MRTLFSIFIVLSLPAFAVAQNYSNSPIMVVTPDSSNPKPPPEPPQPANPPSPPNPPQPASPATPITPGLPATLWPKDTVPIFMTSCTKFHVELIEPCSCIITKVVTQFRHDEFMKIDAAGELTSNPKMHQIRQECMSAALEEQQRAKKE